MENRREKHSDMNHYENHSIVGRIAVYPFITLIHTHTHIKKFIYDSKIYKYKTIKVTLKQQKKLLK